MWFIWELISDPFFILGLLLTSLYLYLTTTFDYWAKKKVPFRKPTILFGNFKDLLLFRKSLPEGMLEMYNWFKNEKYFGVFRLRTPNFILRNPELIKNVLVKDFACFCNRAFPVSKEPLSEHLFNLKGEKWKCLRSKLTPIFSSGKIKRMFYLLEENSTQLEKLIAEVGDDDSIVEVRELAARFAIDVIGTCAFGIQTKTLNSDDCEFRKMAKKVSNSSLKIVLWRMLRSALPNLFKIFRVQMIDYEVRLFFKDLITQILRQRRDSDTQIKRHDFVDLLIELRNNDTLESENGNTQAAEIEFDDNTIASQAFVFFIAGYETSSNAIAFCLYELALNPEIQETTRQDILNAMENYDGKLTYEAVQEMKYLDMVVSETLRKYPASALITRRCEYPYKIPGSDVELPAGMRVIIPIYGLHHDPIHYPDPEKFDPERFNEQNKTSRHPFVYLPFGEGPRQCIGQRFSLLETKIAIISFLRNHRVEICQKSPIPLVFSKRSFVISSEKGIHLKIVSVS